MAELRRFFFDDGSSRKRWHIQQRGKQQIVHAGRLGRTLKESATAFPSPAEARLSVETFEVVSNATGAEASSSEIV